MVAKQKFKNPELVEKINELYQHRSEPGMRALFNLLSHLIQQVREENDNVDVSELKKNQGRIESYIQIKNYIESGLGNQQ